MKFKLLSLFAVLCMVSGAALSQNTNRLITGRVVDKENKQRLISATVWVAGTNISTVTNAKGEFSIRLNEKTKADSLSFSYVGYKVTTLAVGGLFDKSDQVIALEPSVVNIKEITVRGGDANELVKEALKKIPDNYPNAPSNIVTFYREVIKKRNNYLAIAEAVLFSYKSSYMTAERDEATIYKGRRNIDYNKLDTLLFKLQGGINSAFELDVVKNPDNLSLSKESNYYKFEYGVPEILFDRMHYVVHFFPIFQSNEELLFRGTLYIDMERAAITRCEFFMNVEENPLAEKVFIKRKPAGVKATPILAKYVSEYRPQDGKWYLNYVSSEVQFRCKWPKRLFASTYSVVSEMVVTDRSTTNVEKIGAKSRVRSSEIIVEKLTDFTDDEFWEGYNIIEPDQSIEAIVKRIEKQLKREKVKR